MIPSGDSGDTAWVLAAASLALLLTIPGLALFYAGLVRSRSMLSVLMQCVSIAALASLLWAVIGYSLSFDESFDGTAGGFGRVFFHGIDANTLHGEFAIPEIVFAVFQMGFAILAPALLVGAGVERVKFTAMLMIAGAWSLLVYAPATHWARSDDGWLSNLQVMDYAGGMGVYAAAAAAALTLAAVAGRRREFPNEPPPHNVALIMAGAGLLWVGSLVMAGGSALSANGQAAMAIAVTHLSASAAAFTWTTIEWVKTGKPTLSGTAIGAVAGLAAAAAAAGYVGPIGGLILGALAGFLCYPVMHAVKRRLKIDDSLNVFAMFGVSSIIGVLLASVLSLEALDGAGVLVEGGNIGEQLGVQALGLAAVMAWSAIATFIIAKVAGLACNGLRVDPEDEIVGLDIAVHGEAGYEG